MWQWLIANWYSVLITVYSIFNFILNAISASLEAPTKDSTASYKFWFKMVNYFALNWKRGGDPPRVENSPNFEAAAEAYMQRKLAEQQGGKP